MHKKQLKEVNFNYQSGGGKFFQMYGGLRSSLLNYKNDTLFLEIQMTKKWYEKRDAMQTAFHIAKEWKKFLLATRVRNVKEVIRFEAQCTFLMPTENVGHHFNATEDRNALAQQIIAAAQDLQKPLEKHAERTITISGYIDTDAPWNLWDMKYEPQFPGIERR